MKTASGIPCWPSRDPIEEEGGENLYAFVANSPITNSENFGLWFADGLTRTGIKDHGIALDGQGKLRIAMAGGSSEIQKIHERTHIAQISGGPDPRNNKNKFEPSIYWPALPYKQLYWCCAEDKNGPIRDGNGKIMYEGWCYFENKGSREKGEFVKKFQKRNESDLWPDGSGVWMHSTHEMADLEIPAIGWEISKTIAQDRKGVLQKYLKSMLTWKSGDNIPNPVWNDYLKAVVNEKKRYKDIGLEWKWKIPEHVYQEFSK